MTFQNPYAFLLLLLVPLYYIFRRAGLLKKPSYITVLGDWNGKIFEWKDLFHKIVGFISTFALGAGFVLAVIAFADPNIRHQEKIYTTRGTDILFVLDTSPSMVAKDVNGKTRLQAAKDAVSVLFSQNKGARCGIVAMGSEAAVVVPPTSDISIFNTRLQSLSEGTMGDGSAIGAGISTAVYHLVSSAAPKRCIILFTDGENNAGAIHPETAAELAAKNNITLYVFGVGTKGTVSINYTDPNTGKQYSGYLNSDFDSNVLRRIAAAGNGKYFETATITELAKALEAITETEITAQDFTYKTVNDSYYKKILYICLIFFIVGWFLKRFVLKYRKIIPVRSICFGIAGLLFLLSLSGFTWGTYTVPVRKNSNAVSMVFDISNSMLAKDEDNRMSRLDAASVFAKKLLSRMPGTSVSVVLSKGEGITAVPLTEDYALVESLLDSLSPDLMSAPGTNLAKGILAAKSTFHDNISASEYIWVFTDGGHTDTHLQAALSECIRSGIKVTFIGFGSEEGTSVLAGDKVTGVHSSLEKEMIVQAVNSVSKRMPSGSRYPVPAFMKASEKGTGTKLLAPLEASRNSGEYISYETKSIDHFKLFLGGAILFFVLAILFSEMNTNRRGSSSGKKSALMGIMLVPLLFVSCKGNIRGKATDRILKGAAYYAQSEYEKATAEFLSTLELAESEENTEISDYALYNISTTYMKQNENEAALRKLALISSEAPDQIKYAAFFNAGVIAYRNGQKPKAAEYFRKALETDSSKIEAKINLELSLNQTEITTPEVEATLKGASDGESDITDLEKTVFERIKENDKGQWKNSQTSKETDLSSDY